MNDAFHKQHVSETNRILTRDEDAPQIGVHIMSEMIYCERAAKIAIESREDDTGSEFTPAPALGGIPTHEIDDMERALEPLEGSLKRVALAIVSVTGVICAVALFDYRLGGVLAAGAVVGVFSSVWLGGKDLVVRYYRLRQLIRVSRRAKQREPNWSLAVQQEIRWWELIESGFHSREPHQSLYNPDVNLKGRPWRILHRGSVRLPVLRIHVADYDPSHATQVHLTEQQRARLAAYAFLIETCQRGQADWAIVLFNNSYDGLAIPVDQQHWRAFRDGLLKARESFRRFRDEPRYQPGAPDGRRQCIKCPFGRPRRVGLRPTVLGGTHLPAFATSDRQSRAEFHSTCGDRFGDVPPHQLADELGLLDRD